MKLSMTRKLGALALVAMLGACATHPEKEGEQGLQQQINAAEQAGSLETLFDKFAADAGKKGMFGENKEAQAAMKATGARLAALKQEESLALLKQGRLPGGQVPLALLTQAETTAAHMQRWDAQRAQAYVTDLADERARTQKALDQANAAYRSLDAASLPARYRLQGDIAALTGATSPEGQALLRKREQLLQEADEAGVQALEAGRLEEAQTHFLAIREVAPNYKGLDQQLTLTQVRQFEFLANNRRDDAGADQALAMYKGLQQRADFSDLKPQLSAAAEGLYQFMIAKGGSASSEDKLPEAYAWLSRARVLRDLQGTTPVLSAEEKHFAEQIYTLADAAGKNIQPGLALGYLFVAQDVDPDYPELKRSLREMQDRTLDRATKKITAANFSGSGDSARLGGAVASRLTQILFRALPNDVRIVEREQLQAVMREQEIVSMQGSSNVKISSADYLVQGSILEATVENSEKKGRKTMRVVTRKNQIPNPDYAVWAKGARTTPAPAEFHEEPVYEDIPLNIALQRKVGVLSVSYRIVDASNARMLFTDNLTRKREESGESSEGVQLGDFTAPMKIAELPSDSEILESLVDQVAEQIGKQMIDFLRDSEAKYEAAAERLKGEDNAAGAADMLANAWALTQKKGKPVESLGKQLRDMALHARPAA